MTVSPQLLARLGRRWDVRLTFALSFILLAFRKMPSGLLLTLATVVLATAEMLIYMGEANEMVQLATALRWPRWFAWAGKLVLFGGLVAILGFFLGLLAITNPVLGASALPRVAVWAVLVGAAPMMLVGVPIVVGGVGALLVTLPFTGIRALYRKHARRRYRYPTRLG